ncbi:MAG: hypothetical protein BWZ02_00091 [Lentisphaerae bacterium ADurb.BinA184]|nr:MAG: hypothetical protein BWZ02_00091 [Lentisphaerae bacterium ADurb.BinA184]
MTALDVYGNASPVSSTAAIVIGQVNTDGEYAYEDNDQWDLARRILPVSGITFGEEDTGDDTEDDSGGDTGGDTGGGTFTRRTFEAAEAQVHAIYPRADVDWFWFIVEDRPGENLTRVIFETNDQTLFTQRDALQTSSTDAFDTVLWLYDAAGKLIATIDDVGTPYVPPSTKYARFEGLLPPGKYYVKVAATSLLATIEEYTAVLILEPDAALSGPTAPTSVTLSPYNPLSADPLVCDATGAVSGTQSGALAYYYVWYRDGLVVPFGTAPAEPWEGMNYELVHATSSERPLPLGFVVANVLPPAYTAEGQRWMCKVYAKDANGYSEAFTSNEVAIGRASWRLPLIVRKTVLGEAAEVEQEVVIGLEFGATHGFDQNLDEKLPPPDTDVPPVPGGFGGVLWEERYGASYSIGLDTNHLRLTTDMRPYGGGSAWYLAVEFGEDTTACAIEWSLTGLPQGIGSAPLTITEVESWGAYLPVLLPGTDMSKQTRVVIPQGEISRGGRKVYRIGIGSPQNTQTVRLTTGWNLISFAVTPVNPSTAAIFGAATQNVLAGPVWAFRDGRYVRAETIEANRGYWLMCVRPNGYSATVYGPRGNHEVPLVAGWNLVGSTETVDEPNRQVDDGVFAYSEEADASYFEVNEQPGQRPLPSWHVPGQLVRGYGYWIHATEDTVIPTE